MKKFLFAMALSFVATFSWAADVLVVGTESTYPPFEMRDSSGELVGFDIDLVNAIGQKLGMQVQWQDMSFDSLIPSLLTNKIQLIAAGMTATPERMQVIDFTSPYYSSADAWLTCDGTKVESVDVFKGKTVGVQMGTIQDLKATEMGFTVRRYKTTNDAALDLTLGRIDAFLVDAVVGQRMIASNQFKGMELAYLEEDENGALSLGLSKKNSELKNKIETVLEEMASSGELERLRQKWTQ